MTIEEKAKAYDKALERARIEYKNEQSKGNIWDCESLSTIFPELKESEDEKIRKALIFGMYALKEQHKTYFASIPIDNAIAWLEKQAEQKPIEMKTAEESLGIDSDTYNKIIDECIFGEQKSTDKVEPKFKVGDWITDGYLHYKITDVLEDRYIVDTKFVKRSAILFNNESSYHLWSIQDAKDGDVLADKDNNIGIFQECEDIYWNSYIYLGCDGELRGFSIGGKHEQTNTHPATKEQRGILFKKMKEKGYEWDAENKEVKKIEQKPTDEEIKTLLRTEYEKGRADAIAEMQKPAWSEDDEYEDKMQIIINIIKDSDPDWEELINWLKSLRPQSQWKPSDEQMKVLEELVEDNNQRYFYSILKSLYEQLKKLK